MKPAWEGPHWKRRVSRRSLLMAGAAGVYGAALSGCGLTAGLSSVIQRPLRLSVLVIGSVGKDGQPFVQALRSAEQSYAAAHRGRITLDITTTALPPVSWYNGVLPGATGIDVVLGSRPVVATATGEIIAVSGRSALDIKFGNVTSVPRPALQIPSPPDIIIAYDVWVFWLGLFAADVSEFWKQASADREGIETFTTTHGEIYCPGRGTLFGALPLLRSPMGLFCSRNVVSEVTAPVAAKADWTWDALTHALQAATFGIGTGRFSVNKQDDESFDVGRRVIAAEATASFVSAYGNRLATTTAATAAPAFTTAGALKALNAFVAFRSAGHLPASEETSIHPWIAPAYLWEPLGGGVLSIYANNPNKWVWALNPGGVFYPWPSGSSRRAVPASYLCAYLWKDGQHLSQAGDFCTFLLSSGAQRELARAGGGFALRSADAMKQLPFVGAQVARPADAVRGSDDLNLADLYGGWKTDQNAAAVDSIADSFAKALSAVNQELPAPSALSALVRNPSGV